MSSCVIITEGLPTVHDVAEAGGILCVVAGDGHNGELDLTGIDDEELDKVCYCCCCCLP